MITDVYLESRWERVHSLLSKHTVDYFSAGHATVRSLGGRFAQSPALWASIHSLCRFWSVLNQNLLLLSVQAGVCSSTQSHLRLHRGTEDTVCAPPCSGPWVSAMDTCHHAGVFGWGVWAGREWCEWLPSLVSLSDLFGRWKVLSIKPGWLLTVCVWSLVVLSPFLASRCFSLGMCQLHWNPQRQSSKYHSVLLLLFRNPIGAKLKDTPCKDTSLPENVENLQIFQFAGLIWWFYQCLCNRSNIFLQIWVPQGAAMLVHS